MSRPKQFASKSNVGRGFKTSYNRHSSQKSQRSNPSCSAGVVCVKNTNRNKCAHGSQAALNAVCRSGGMKENQRMMQDGRLQRITKSYFSTVWCRSYMERTKNLQVEKGTPGKKCSRTRNGLPPLLEYSQLWIGTTFVSVRAIGCSLVPGEGRS